MIRSCLVAAALVTGIPAGWAQTLPQASSALPTVPVFTLYDALGRPSNWTISGTLRPRVEALGGQFRPAPTAPSAALSIWPTPLLRARPAPLTWPERETVKRDAAPVLKEFKAGLTLDVQTACLSAAMDDIEAGLEPANAAAQGWARGDVGAALKAPRGIEKCFLAVSGGPEVWRQGIEDQAAAIAAELERPGKAVAMVRLRQLIAKGGVIEQLEATGLDVDGPAVR